MPYRILRNVVVVALGLLGALGAVVVGLSSGAFVAVVITSTIAGVAVAAQVHGAGPAEVVGSRPDSRLAAAVRAGRAAAVTTVAALLVAAGLVGLLGANSAYVIAPLIACAAVWKWRRRDRRNLATAHHREVVRAPVVVVPGTDPAVMSVAQLCRAWDRSYWLLYDLPAGPARITIVGNRERLLDELERRDPTGFRLWMSSGASASSNPRRYLTGHRDSGGGHTTPPPAL